MLDLRLTHLALLSEIVSTGSLSEAAEHLGLTVASASRMLKKMQEDSTTRSSSASGAD
ncbi:helix-turn-helix domain-containing protein [Sutterella seckii]|nr:LysR family transcriptional regulator [Sutterella seckii]